MSNARDKANIPVLNFQSKGIDDNADATAITIDSSESLGLGTTSPFNSRAGSFTISNEAPTIYMEDTNSSGSGVGQILYSNGDLAYSTGTRNGTGTSNSTEHFRIKNDGKIGIGTGSPGVTLDVNSSTQTTLLHLNSTAGTSSAITFANTGSNDSIAISSENDDLKLRTDDGVIKFFTNENSEKMRIDSSGNVGIGNTVMSSFSNLPATNLVVGSGSGNQGITIYSGNTSASNIGFADGSSGDARNQGIIQYHHNGDYMRFFTSASERMRLNSTGLGVGTSNPVKKLVASNAGAEGIELSPGDSSNVNMVLNYNRSTSAYIASQQRASYHRFDIDTTEGMRLTSTGLGIGTSSPGTKLDVNGTIGVGSGNSYRFGDNGNTRIEGSNAVNVRLGFFTGGSERMRIDSSGNVGIGTSSPNSLGSNITTLEITGGSTIRTGGVRINNSNNTISASFYGSNTGATFGTESNSNLKFVTNNNERVRIDSSGNVGIGTTSPDVKFHVVDTGSSQAAKIHSDTNNAGVLGMSVLAGLDTPSSSGDCKWVRLADGNDSGKAYIQFKSSSPNAEFAAISDERLKTNIQDTDVVGLDVINNLRLVKFDWNETATQDAGWSMHGHQKLGFVAQEVEAIAPEFISEDTNGFKIMGDSGFVPYLIKAMQEQQTKIEELEARITALETTP